MLNDPDNEKELSAESTSDYPVGLELEFSHAYADPGAFSDDDITALLFDFVAVQEQGQIDAARAADLDTLIDRISFEFWRRLYEEFASKPGDDNYLDAYDNPYLIERDFDDPGD